VQGQPSVSRSKQGRSTHLSTLTSTLTHNFFMDRILRDASFVKDKTVPLQDKRGVGEGQRAQALGGAQRPVYRVLTKTPRNHLPTLAPQIWKSVSQSREPTYCRAGMCG
jgi:hypothetical protein